MKRFFLTSIFLCLAFISFSQETVTFKDSHDGKTNKWVKIGNQTWLAENLKFKDKTGSFITDNNPEYYKRFGMFYNFETAQKVSPTGWHLPSDNEWMELNIFLGERKVSGGKLKDKSV